jgi:hypothetical protein
MFNIGDRVIHKTTKNIGQIFGYGHRVIDGIYLPTLLVRVKEGTKIYPKGCLEDLSSEWMPTEKTKTRNSRSMLKVSPKSQQKEVLSSLT